MKRFLAALFALLAIVLVSGGCNVSSIPPVAARVGSSNIPTAQLDASMRALQADSGYLCQGGEGPNPVTAGAGTDTWSASFTDFVLTQLIKFRILDEMVAARHLVPPASDRAEATTEAEAAVNENLSLLQQESVACPGTPTTIIEGLGSPFGPALLGNQVNDDVYSAYLAGTSLQPAALASWERSHAAQTTQSCTSAIEVTTEARALQIRHAILGGASFATEANRYGESTGAGTGGAVGCVLKAQWADGLGSVVAGLTVGVVSHPVKFQSGWLLLEVTQRKLEPLSYVVPQIDQLESAAFGRRYSKALSSTDISIASIYGSLERKAVQGGYSLAVVPPSAKACAYALSPSAAGCPTAASASATGATG